MTVECDSPKESVKGVRDVSWLGSVMVMGEM